MNVMISRKTELKWARTGSHTAGWLRKKGIPSASTLPDDFKSTCKQCFDHFKDRHSGGLQKLLHCIEVTFPAGNMLRKDLILAVRSLRFEIDEDDTKV